MKLNRRTTAFSCLLILCALAASGQGRGKNPTRQPPFRAKSTSASRFSAVPPQAPYYELRCRGGVSLNVGSDPLKWTSQQLQFVVLEGRTKEKTNEHIMNMLINFAPGTEAVSLTGSSLRVGQCSWVDRGFLPGEPSQIRQDMIYFGQQKQALDGTPIDRSPTAAERFPDCDNVPKYMSDGNHYWSFLVRNSGHGYLEATSSHYWKPTKLIPDAQKVGSGAKVTVPTTDSQKATTAGADELNPQPLPPCEKCPQIKKVPPAQQKKVIRKQPTQD
jgi:hypothetical protein